MWEGARKHTEKGREDHLSDEEARAGPGGQNPLGCGWNMRVGPGLMMGEKTEQFRQLLPSPHSRPKLGGFQKSSKKDWACVIGKGGVELSEG